MPTSLKEQIHIQLQKSFNPIYLKVENESHKHSFSPNGESHFKVTLVSTCFENKSLLDRQRQVYAVLSSEMKQLHALAQHIFTPTEWEIRNNQGVSGKKEVPPSPPCSNTFKRSHK